MVDNSGCVHLCRLAGPVPLFQQEMELKNQQVSLGQSVVRLRKDIKGLQEAVSDRGIPVPEPGFSLEEEIPTGEEEE